MIGFLGYESAQYLLDCVRRFVDKKKEQKKSQAIKKAIPKIFGGFSLLSAIILFVILLVRSVQMGAELLFSPFSSTLALYRSLFGYAIQCISAITTVSSCYWHIMFFFIPFAAAVTATVYFSLLSAQGITVGPIEKDVSRCRNRVQKNSFFDKKLFLRISRLLI